MDRRKRSSNRIFALCLCICLGGRHGGRRPGAARAMPGLRLRHSRASRPMPLRRRPQRVGCRPASATTAACTSGPQAGKASPSGVLRAVWRESVIASDGTTHENVLAVAVQASVTRPATDVGLGMPAQLEIGNGTSRRSGRFPVAGALDMRRVPARRGATGMACVRERGLGCPAGPHRSYRGTLSHVRLPRRGLGDRGVDGQHGLWR